MCAVILRLHQVNQPRFLSLTCHYSQPAGPGNLIIRRSGLDGRGGGSGGPWPPHGPAAPRPHGPAAAAARVRSERGRSLQPARCSLCASVPAPNFTFSTGRPARPPAPGLSRLPSLLFLCFSSLHFSLGLLPYPVKTIKGKDLESKLEGRSLFPSPSPSSSPRFPCSFPTFLLRPPPPFF